MTNKEKLISKIMLECEKNGEPVTKEEAAEMAEMELKAKQNGRRYEGDTKNRKPATRTLKIDIEKVAILESIAHQLSRFVNPFENGQDIEDVQIKNKQKEITFRIGENRYSLILTKHRNEK